MSVWHLFSHVERKDPVLMLHASDRINRSNWSGLVLGLLPEKFSHPHRHTPAPWLYHNQTKATQWPECCLGSIFSAASSRLDSTGTATVALNRNALIRPDWLFQFQWPGRFGLRLKSSWSVAAAADIKFTCTSISCYSHVMRKWLKKRRIVSVLKNIWSSCKPLIRPSQSSNASNRAETEVHEKNSYRCPIKHIWHDFKHHCNFPHRGYFWFIPVIASLTESSCGNCLMSKSWLSRDCVCPHPSGSVVIRSGPLCCGRVLV